ncbi:serine-protein kinase RsbW [Oceanobacillus oncorhynchi subsp. incaldanensis]|uniref:Serine-protein kinase RsbW n=2 Tax=Oceanobacillus TaxID=182709 RepID=A0A0A1MB07_9BACI|nr:anti-sigma B factor RsbW [Oceanobacillus oncorhynchi]MDM8102648.1 anti-sigma B factor RsbW [Oceanobacillus oncorhynchi]UUI41082.1 anti-sigma B factor RsbW [Oceanobacillus oncorhynchi]GIO21326.1 serine-protein kinase RsbW [Oceanobacillus oncorhynchi subsp. incaldanensis]CEI82535.1 Serine-protein kinase RsbW [Oceanobacillus oncorhynchi]
MEAFDYIEMKVPAKAEYIGVMRLTLSGVANRMGFSYDAIEDLKVAISEAVTNAVEHAYEEKESGEITVGFGLYEDRMEIMVADRGGSFDLEEVKNGTGPYQSDEPVEKIREGGFGLFLIEALMDEVKINNKYGVMVIMTKYNREEEVDMDDDQISTIQ